MFFSDFFRRLESDRRLFSLSPVGRNRVYVRPRAEDASPAPPVKFPRPPATTKKGRLGVASTAGSVRSSPFMQARRRLAQRWDHHKIDSFYPPITKWVCSGPFFLADLSARY